MAPVSDNKTNPANGSAANTGIHLAIVGGGIAGLCLALGILNRAPHISIHVYEAAHQFAEIGAGVGVGINARRALQKLDARLGEAYAKLKTGNVDSNVDSSAADCRTRQKETYLRLVMGMDHATDPNYKAGTEICEIFTEGGSGNVHRARFLDKMIAMLPEEVRKNCVTFGARLVDLEEIDGEGKNTGVKLIFADGRTATADAVIACDGIKSQLKRILLDPTEAQPVFSGKYAYRGLIPMDKAAEALGDWSARNGHHRCGYGGHVLTFPIDHGNTMNVVAFQTKRDGKWTADEWVKAANHEEMQADFAGWGEDVRTILRLMERTDMWALFDHPPASTYHRQGRICLIGDAAHASTPHHGSGAGLAVEDALLISGLLQDVRGKEDLEKLFSAYEQTRKERTQRLVRSSREQAMLYDLEAAGVGDDIAKIAKIVPRRWDWIWDHDLDRELDEARAIMETRDT